jgi:hypothetical protein
MSKTDEYKPSGRTKLLPHVKKAWVEKLRSGRRQVRAALKSKDHNGKIGYCCLGILCDLGDKAKDRWEKPTVSWDDEWTYDGEDGMPPNDVLKAANLSHMNASILAEMNDAGIGFKAIASWIEKHL